MESKTNILDRSQIIQNSTGAFIIREHKNSEGESQNTRKAISFQLIEDEMNFAECFAEFLYKLTGRRL